MIPLVVAVVLTVLALGGLLAWMKLDHDRTGVCPWCDAAEDVVANAAETRRKRGES